MAEIYDALTADWLKSTFLLGIDLTLDDGTAYPDTIYKQSLRGAVSYLEHELGIVINQRSIVSERHDALDINRESWWGFRLDQRPVLSFDKWFLRFGSFEPVSMPVGWLQLLSAVSGQVHLIPSQEQLGSFLYSAGVPLLMGGFVYPYHYIPGYFSFNYQAGFDMRSGTATLLDGQTEVEVALSPDIVDPYQDAYLTGVPALGALSISSSGLSSFTIKSTVAASGDQPVAWSITTVPSDIMQCLGLKASLLPIDIAGDLIAGAGIANISIGADGIHQSLGTTCLHPDTRIVLADGTTPTIESLVGVESFAVATVDAVGTSVVGIGRHARETIEDDVLAVRLSNQQEVRCNASHPFRLPNGDYVPAGELTVGQALTPCDLVTDERTITVLDVRPTGERLMLYDITVDDHNCFGIGQGVVVHNSSATNSGYGARRQAYERELKSLLPALRAKYKTINFGCI